MARTGRAFGFALAVLALALLGCGGAMPGAEAAPDEASFEALPPARAEALLPDALRVGPHHRVREEVGLREFLHHYTIDSDFGVLEAHGDARLRTRVAEIAALGQLDRMQKRDEFANALAAGLKSPFVAAWNLLRDPVDSILGVPQAAWETLEKTARLARRERSELEDSGLREFIGFESKKRELAYELGVDPYSSNPLLQKQLNRFAWASYLGGLPFAIVPFQGEEEGEASGAVGSTDRLREILRHYSPEDLRRLNRIELAVMGVGGERADAFLSHAWYSPRHATVLVESLVALDLTEGRAAFVDAAAQAKSETEAWRFQRSAELLRRFHENREGLARLSSQGTFVVGRTHEGGLVVPLVADRVTWSPASRALRDRIAGTVSTSGQAQLLVSGTVTPAVREAFDEAGIRITEDAFERLAAEGAE